MSSNQATRLCLVRHGETEWNLGQRIQGHRDMPLNATGLNQAQALAVGLTEQRFSAIYCSDLQRARQTAEPLAKALGMTVNIEPELRERNFGCCEGQTFEEIMAGDAEVAHGLTSRQPDYVLPGGESLQRCLDLGVETRDLVRLEEAFDDDAAVPCDDGEDLGDVRGAADPGESRVD